MHSEDKALNDNTGISAHFGTYYYDGGNGFTYRLKKYGSGSGKKAENMGAGKHDPEGYVWMLNMDGHRGAQFNNFYTHIGCGAMPGFQNVVMVYANSWKPYAISEAADVRNPLVQPIRRTNIREERPYRHTPMQAHTPGTILDGPPLNFATKWTQPLDICPDCNASWGVESPDMSSDDVWYTFRSSVNGLMMQATDRSRVFTYGRHVVPGSWEKMKIEPVPNTDRLHTIKSSHGRFFWVDRDLNIMANKDRALGWEHFQFHAAEYGTVLIYSPAHSCWFGETNPYKGHMKCTKDRNAATKLYGWYQPEGVTPHWKLY